mmetsp:Transcript_18436/g.27607  ORF Transcript_18436/g.27607 Transcript_18436/m.27607 type:complete len:149 (-) Transcript_18436:246-692(-)
MQNRSRAASVMRAKNVKVMVGRFKFFRVANYLRLMARMHFCMDTLLRVCLKTKPDKTVTEMLQEVMNGVEEQPYSDEEMEFATKKTKEGTDKKMRESELSPNSSKYAKKHGHLRRVSLMAMRHVGHKLARLGGPAGAVSEEKSDEAAD